MIKVTVKVEGKDPKVRMFSNDADADWYARALVRTAETHGITIESLTIGNWNVI